MKIDAEYMNRWLGESSKIEDLSAKVLYDIKTLIEYYKDIIVPTSDVSIEFPIEGKNSSPRASVERGEVLIPYYMLAEGEIDNTIGAMIHELHHIKLSCSERFLSSVCFKFLRQLMEQIDCGSMTMADRLFSDASVTADKIMGWTDDKVKGTSDVLFLREAVGDLMFLLNAVEDVRIDANTPPNLKKYIDKLESQAAQPIIEKIKSGEFTNEDRDLNSIAFMILVHHKGIHSFDFVKERYGDTQGIIDSDPHVYPLEVFTEFKEEIASHLLGRYYYYCGVPKDQSGEGDSSDLDLDAYFGSKVKAAIGDGLDTQFENTSSNSKLGNRPEEDAALKGLSEKIKEISVSKDISPAPTQNDSGGTKEDVRIDLSEKADTVRDWGDWRNEEGSTPQEVGRELRNEIEDSKKTVFLQPTMNTQINSFKNVQIITTSEHFGDTNVVYDSVLFDTVN